MTPPTASPVPRSRPAFHTLLPVVLLLWVVWILRAHDVLAMPVFVDESLHILRGRVVWSFSDLGESLIPKKLLYYYWIGLFGLDTARAVWLARTATALLALPGAALTYALAARLFDRRAGALALALAAFTPFLVFFERLALADGLAMVLGLAVAWTGLRLARQPSAGRGALIGALLGLAVLAKLIALPFGALPPLAVALYAPQRAGTWRGAIRSVLAPPYRRAWLAGVLAFFVVLAPSLIYVIYEEATGPERVVVEESLYATGDRLGEITANAEHVIRACLALLAPELVALAGGLVGYLAWRAPRALAYLLAGVLLPWGGVVLVAADLSTRYLLLGVPFVLIILAGGVVDAAQWLATARRHAPNRGPVWRLHWLAWALLAFWLISFAAPFARTAMTDPARLDLPPRDEWEYVTHTSSGYALRDLAADLPGLPPDADGRIRVIGYLPSCHSLPLYWTAPNTVDLTCPLFKWDTADAQGLYDRLVREADAAPPVYMAVDETAVFDLATLPFAWDLLAAYPRPHGGKVVRLYRVTLAEGHAAP